MIRRLLLVGAGGFLGAVLRYALSGAVHRVVPNAVFPHGTLVVNVVGCIGIGFLAGLIESHDAVGPGARLFLMIGLLGGFTTYSTFALESMHLASSLDVTRLTVNLALHVLLGLAGVWTGATLARMI